ncbi:MAG TPA: septum site-determining protein MinC [Polyangia bacterium]|nr:septum site-determining protein MinC [Polyangia bacterium]
MSTTRKVIFELKGVMTSLAVMRLRTPDLGAIERHLRMKIAQLPQFFIDAPVALDLSALPGDEAAIPLRELVALLRACRLVPVGITEASEGLRDRAAAEGLGVLNFRAGRLPAGGATVPAPAARPAEPAPRPDPRSAAPARAPMAAPAPHRPPVVIRQPIRGGQVIFAENADLVILAPVNPGAEVIADGHVHIYSTLRGRAVAGAHGSTEARIFCQRLQAELVSIAGAYIMADDIPDEHRGQSVQIYLDGGECRIAAI